MSLMNLILEQVAEGRRACCQVNALRLQVCREYTSTKSLRTVVKQLEKQITQLEVANRLVRSGLFELMNSGISHRRFLQFVKEVERGE